MTRWAPIVNLAWGIAGIALLAWAFFAAPGWGKAMVLGLVFWGHFQSANQDIREAGMQRTLDELWSDFLQRRGISQ